MIWWEWSHMKESNKDHSNFPRNLEVYKESG